MKPQSLDLESEVFDEFRANLDAAIRMTVAQLVQKDLTAGTINTKIDIAIKKEADEETGEIIYIPTIEPDVKIKFGAKGGLKCKRATGFLMKQKQDGTFLIGSKQIEIDELMKGA